MLPFPCSALSLATRVLAGLGLMVLILTLPARAVPPPAIGLVVVESGDPQSANEAWQRTFLVNFAAALAQNGGPSLHVVAEAASPRAAAEHLRNHRCDAALLIGDDRPAPLRRLNGPTFAATLSFELGRRSIFLVLDSQDESLRTSLQTGFETALADETFQALIQGRLRPAPALVAAP